jgi:phytoene desaturase
VLDATADLALMEERVAALAPEDAPNLRRFLADNRAKLEAFRPILESPFNGPRDLFRRELLPALPWLAPWRSLDGELGRYFADPRLRLAFSFQSKYLGMSPFRCPSLFSILSFLEYEHGVFHPVGGCAAVMETTARLAREMGVEIRLDDPVAGFDFRGRRPVAARTAAGERIEADAFVVNADFAHAMERLVPDRLRRRWSDRRLAEKRFSCSTFMLYLGIDGVERELPHHTIYVAREYRRNLDDIERAHRLSEDPSFYVQNACVTDPSLAPRGASTLYVLVPVPHQSPRIDWRRLRGPFRERVLAQLGKVGLEDVERRIRFERTTTPDDWAERHAVYRGATFNLAHGLDQMLHRRPRNRFE